MITPARILENFEAKLASISDPEKQVIEIIEFSLIYGDSFDQRIIPYLDRGISISRKINFPAGEALCYANLVFFQVVTQGDAYKSNYIQQASNIEEMLEKIKYDPYFYSLGLSLLSYFYWFKGEYEKAFNNIFKALKFSEGSSTSIGHSWNCYALGVFYFDTKDYINSERYYAQANELFKTAGNEYGQARACNGIASVAILKKDTAKAIPLLEYAESIYRKVGHHSGLSRALNDMGLIEKANADYDKAISLLNESISLRKEISHIQGLVTSLTEISETYLLMGEYEKAHNFLNEALMYCRQVKSRQKEIRLHKLFSDLYKKTGQTELALQHFEEFYNLKTQLMSDEATSNIQALQTSYATEKSEKEAEIHRLKNVELKNAYHEIAEKNKEITDSINYAKRIQQAILPNDEEITKCLPGSFILYQPKDVVSGDFYWMARKQNTVFLAAIDCTGHGVPGAFMSMIGNTLLNEIVNEKGLTNPAEILFHLREGVIKSLKQTGASGENKDGMDIALCSITGEILNFAGANNPLWIFGKNGFIEIKGDKQPIGIHSAPQKPFTNHIVTLTKDDCIFIFTDGYADQFGGPSGKKFKYKQMQKIILENAGKPMNELKHILDTTLSDWKGSLEQVDDILVIGIRI